MKSLRQIVPLNELYGKGMLSTIGKHHDKAAKKSFADDVKNPRVRNPLSKNRTKTAYHTAQSNRATALQQRLKARDTVDKHVEKLQTTKNKRSISSSLEKISKASQEEKQAKTNARKLRRTAKSAQRREQIKGLQAKSNKKIYTQVQAPQRKIKVSAPQSRVSMIKSAVNSIYNRLKRASR